MIKSEPFEEQAVDNFLRVSSTAAFSSAPNSPVFSSPKHLVPPSDDRSYLSLSPDPDYQNYRYDSPVMPHMSPTYSRYNSVPRPQEDVYSMHRCLSQNDSLSKNIRHFVHCVPPRPAHPISGPPSPMLASRLNHEFRQRFTQQSQIKQEPCEMQSYRDYSRGMEIFIIIYVV